MAESENITTRSSSKPWSETRNGRMAAAAGVLGLFVLVFWLAMKSRGMMTQGLVVDEKYLSFGETWEDQEFGWILPIRNTANQDVEIAGFTTSCSCAKIDPKSLTVPAHGTREVRLTLNLHIPIDLPDITTQDFNVYIKPWVKNGPASHSGWTIHGVVQKAFRVEPGNVDYEGSLVEGTRFHPRKVKITPLIPLQKVQAVCDPSELAIEIKETEGKQYELSVCPNVRPAGAFSFAVAIQGRTDKGSQIPAIKIPIVGRIMVTVHRLKADVH